MLSELTNKQRNTIRESKHLLIYTLSKTNVSHGKMLRLVMIEKPKTDTLAQHNLP